MIRNLINLYRWLRRILRVVKEDFLLMKSGMDKLGVYALMHHIAETGEGSDKCLENGFLPLRVHFYSPIPDIKDLEDRGVWQKVSLMGGIDFKEQDQLVLLQEIGEQYGAECEWPKDKTLDPYQFWTNNGGFSYGCAATLYSLARLYKPKHIIEIGSGNSSLVISSALNRNKQEHSNYSCDYTIIDPYPWIQDLPRLTHLIKDRVECVDDSIFQQLNANDILFIDSSHTVKIGGDVNYLILDVIPFIKPGVIIHFHDICLPFEYPSVYYTNPAFRVFWTEAYLLQAFLSCNHEFEILLAMNFLQAKHMDKFCKAFPHFDLKNNWGNSSSFWIRRKLS